ncbi:MULTISPECIES: plasmid partition protein ParG [unclassified Streptomyces]|uniref:plasmid partition protein ParG n=1 Tax=unclassified Streptomyces TaxID=2593676 RepID=UPI0037FE6D81
MSRRQGRTADNGGNRPHPVLPAEDDDVVVGDQVAATATPAPKRRRPPFGSYMDKDLQREFKARCALQGIEMQDALDDAVRNWLDKYRP